MANESQMYLLADDKCISVIGTIGETDQYIDGKGYIEKDTGNIFVYSDSPLASARIDNTPRFHMEEDGTMTFQNEIGGDSFNIKNANTCSMSDIRNETVEGQVLYNDRILADMNASTNAYKPIINESDDFMKKMIKQAILVKGINIKMYQERMPNKYIITNLKSALSGSTKMTVTTFVSWCDILGLDFTLTIKSRDDGDGHPLGGEIVFDSYKGTMEFIEDERGK